MFLHLVNNIEHNIKQNIYTGMGGNLSCASMILCKNIKNENVLINNINNKKYFFFLSIFSFTDSDNTQGSRGREGFLSRTVTIHRAAGEGRGPFLIPLYHFYQLANIQTFMCNFAREMSITYF